ncbi:hypothetical protein BDR26DRAFT_873871 [Obelidium mucronatum]|nr:hypothetical protein BDR26DRAFT_873871 [Obelidium mucronatum]
MFVSIVVWAALFGAGVVHYNLWVIPLANVIILFLIQPKRPKVCCIHLVWHPPVQCTLLETLFFWSLQIVYRCSESQCCRME